MVYVTLFLIGLLGLVAQVLLGGAHGPTHHGHLGTTHSAGGHHAGHGHAHGRTPGQGGRPGLDLLLTILSPLTLFSLCLGAGATGLMLKHAHLTPSMIAAVAAVGGLVFYSAIVRPVWSLVFKFASKPSKALEGATANTAEAASKFDENGKGVVKLSIDGQVVRVLANLEVDDRLDADSIRPGDKLTVTSVDGRSNTCRVTRL